MAGLKFDMTLLDERGEQRPLLDVWERPRCVVAFLRHFGCPFAKQHAEKMRDLSERYEKFCEEAQVPEDERATFVNIGIGYAWQIPHFRNETNWKHQLYVVPDAYDTTGGPYGLFRMQEGRDHVITEEVTKPGGLYEQAVKAGHSDGGYGTDNGPKDGKYTGNIHQIGGNFILGPGNVCDYAYRSKCAGDFGNLDELYEVLTGFTAKGEPVFSKSAQQQSELMNMTSKQTSDTAECPFLTGREPAAAPAEPAAPPSLLMRAVPPVTAVVAAGAVTYWGVAQAGYGDPKIRVPATLGVAAAVAALIVPRPRRLPIPELKTARDLDREIVEAGGIDIGDGPALQINMERRRRASSWQVEEARPRPADSVLTGDLAVAAGFLSYVRGFLVKSHPDLGRDGPVCPFMPKALKLDCMYVGIAPTPPDVTIDMMANLVRALVKKFNKLPPTEGNKKFYRAAIVVFPDVPLSRALELIDGTQASLKAELTEQGLMVGEFHILNNGCGLRNESFFPLRTPHPALAVRHMVPSDIAFLKSKPEFLTNFLKQCQEAANFKAVSPEAQQEARELLGDFTN
mmetsp:Transcript_34653/g.75895  ORF Transcript_34653/g.75895 Transcript_34653/m.75895 type:complete len:569 (+) Transcript_34653:38-1744(+)